MMCKVKSDMGTRNKLVSSVIPMLALEPLINIYTTTDHESG